MSNDGLDINLNPSQGDTLRKRIIIHQAHLSDPVHGQLVEAAVYKKKFQRELDRILKSTDLRLSRDGESSQMTKEVGSDDGNHGHRHDSAADRDTRSSERSRTGSMQRPVYNPPSPLSHNQNTSNPDETNDTNDNKKNSDTNRHNHNYEDATTATNTGNPPPSQLRKCPLTSSISKPDSDSDSDPNTSPNAHAIPMLIILRDALFNRLRNGNGNGSDRNGNSDDNDNENDNITSKPRTYPCICTCCSPSTFRSRSSPRSSPRSTFKSKSGTRIAGRSRSRSRSKSPPPPLQQHRYLRNGKNRDEIGMEREKGGETLSMRRSRRLDVIPEVDVEVEGERA